jgi:cytochrome c oxidase subunit 2
VQLQGGRTVIADAGYLRESITNPQAKIVAGFQPIMPTFKGLVSEEGIGQLIAYIKSIGPATNGASAGNGSGKGTDG